jgi:predicted nucleic acid-binding protein
MKEEKIYVIDTSVTAKLFFAEEYRKQAKEVYRQAILKEITLLAPELMCYEINNVLTKSSMSLEKVKKCLRFLKKQIQREIITIVPYSFEILEKAAEIANFDTQGQGHISSFDATFHALALLNDAIFLTADKKHYDKTKNLVGSILHIKDFS